MAVARPHIFVSGASGFLGQALVAEAVRTGARVTALVRARDTGWTEGRAGVRWLTVDHLNPRALADLFQGAGPDMVIDAAGKIRADPGAEGDFDLNVAFVESWIAAFRASGTAARLVTIGSAAQYGGATPRDRATRETDPYAPISAYGISKTAATRAALSAFRLHGVDVRVGLVFNLIGPHQPAHMAPITFVHRALNAGGRPIQIRNDTAIRDFVDVRDVARALIGLGQGGRAGEVYNIGSGQPTRIADLLDQISREVGGRTGAVPVWQAQHEPQDIPVSYADIGKIRDATGWQPERGLAESLSDVIEATLTPQVQPT